MLVSGFEIKCLDSVLLIMIFNYKALLVILLMFDIFEYLVVLKHLVLDFFQIFEHLRMALFVV